jgi:DNA mismatch repair ATPase MutS
MRDRGIDAAANAAGQSADHVLSFFSSLRDELAFYIACERLHRRLAEKGVPVCFPVPREGGARKRACKGLRDAGLALRLDGVVGNELEADGKDVVVITGANQGGKSTFLRAVGLAQLMMQCGMFVAADSFRASVCDGLFTHFRREEDAALESGKFDEELSRMSALADALKPGALVLFNESFAATNDREGSEVAGQIVRALRDSGVEVFYVTHLSDFARALWEEKSPAAHFLRAERLPDGRRTYRLPAGEPLETSFGADLYREVFGDSAAS